MRFVPTHPEILQVPILSAAAGVAATFDVARGGAFSNLTIRRQMEEAPTTRATSPGAFSCLFDFDLVFCKEGRKHCRDRHG